MCKKLQCCLLLTGIKGRLYNFLKHLATHDPNRQLFDCDWPDCAHRPFTSEHNLRHHIERDHLGIPPQHSPPRKPRWAASKRNSVQQTAQVWYVWAALGMPCCGCAHVSLAPVDGGSDWNSPHQDHRVLARLANRPTDVPCSGENHMFLDGRGCLRTFSSTCYLCPVRDHRYKQMGKFKGCSYARHMQSVPIPPLRLFVSICRQSSSRFWLWLSCLLSLVTRFCASL